MKILAPYNTVKSLYPMTLSGVDEVYFGIRNDVKWDELFPNAVNGLNRMSAFVVTDMDYTNWDKIVDTIKAENVAALLTLNANSYTNEQLVYIQKEYYPKIKEAGLGIITSSPIIVKTATDYGILVSTSVMCNIYNSDIANYYKQLGAKRIMFPRDITLDEMGEIIRLCPDMEYEAFSMLTGCELSDGLCTCIHPHVGGTCDTLAHSDVTHYTYEKNFDIQQDLLNTTHLSKTLFRKNGYPGLPFFTCSICSLWKLKEIGVTHLKVVGRGLDPSLICLASDLLKRNLNILEASATEEEYHSNQIYPEASSVCQCGYQCYYPESRVR